MKKISSLLAGVVAIAVAPVSVHAELVINELMQSNVECIMDDLNEFPDSWVELYNNGTSSVNLANYSLGIKTSASMAYKLPVQTVAPGAFVIVYCDKEETGLHTSFRLESGKDGAVYLFSGTNVVDKIEGMKKMPAPDIAYGRITDGADEWGYQSKATPGKANCGKLCKEILGAPVFSQPGKVSSESFNLTLTVPSDAPSGTKIRYTTDGSEPNENSQLYVSAIRVNKTTNVRAKLFCDGYMSPRSTTHSYIFFPRTMTMPIVSIVTSDDYFNGQKLGIYSNNSKDNQNDWRRPINLEIFWGPGKESVINQLCETRVKGGQSRDSKLKSLVLYANKRFVTKRLEYEFFPEDAPGLTDWKSIELRNSGNDFDYMYFRDAVIQRTVGRNADLDWQPYQPAIFMLNGKYMGMLNMRTRSNEDYVYTMYDGLEDIDMFENWYELKSGDWTNYNAFKEFYNGTNHTFAEYETWMDTGEFANMMIMELFYNNMDFPGNNIVMWRPIADGGRWRWIIKDTDFGLGLYGRAYDYKILNWLHDNNYDAGNKWGNTSDATRLFRRLMSTPEFFDMFIDRTAVYLGDFLTGAAIGKEIDAMASAIKYEYGYHKSAVGGWSNHDNEVANAKTWANNRNGFFYTHLADYYKLGTPRPVKIDTGRTDDVEITINDVPLQGRSFEGKYFEGRRLIVEGKSKTGSMVVGGWRVKAGNVTTDHWGERLMMTVPAVSSITIESIMEQSGISDVHSGKTSGVNLDMPVAVYDLTGRKIASGVLMRDVHSSLPSGVYILRQGALSMKMAVK